MPDVMDLPLREELRLAIDSGGSTLRLAACDRDGNELKAERIAYPQDRFNNLDEGIEWFLNELGYRPAVAVIGAAGPIEHGRRVKLTNNPAWPLFDADICEKTLGIRVHLFNDLVIAAASIPSLKETDIDVLRPGTAQEDEPALVVTLSTGINDALALPESHGGLGFVPAESGHTPFAPRSDVEIELLRWTMHNGLRYVGFENIVAGSQGFQRVYDFVTQHLGIEPLPETLEMLEGDVPIGPPLTKAGLELNDPAALKVFEIVGGATASYLASRAIATLSAGGIYLVGSVSQNTALMNYYLAHTPFLARFAEAGPYGRLVKDVPIMRILHKEFGLLGASRIASRMD